ncbi:MAG: hypothetical protein GXO00_01980 [Candidatus Diapherotrites archaeon]|nr:hypothetical protein [Candidatus Diapherotrites archaeon]
MGFGISYEMVITLFVVLFGLLFVVMGYTPLAVPFIQLTFLFGLVMFLVGWMKKDYDQFYTGILLMIIPLILISVFPSVGVPSEKVEAGLFYAIAPILLGLHWLYSVHPIFFVLVIVLIAYALAKK